MPEPQQISRKHRWKVQGRVGVLEYASAHGLKPAAERFGPGRKTVREWRDRAKGAGEVGLVPRFPKRRPRQIPDATVRLIEEARREFGWGACRTRLWLLRVHQIKVAGKTIARICVDLGLPRAQGAKAPRRAPRELKLFEKATPGESVQVDVKVVTVNGTKAYQYTACGDCTRYRVLRLFPRLNTRTSVDFLAELRRVLPFSIQRVQTDHGTEFSFDFVLAVQLGGSHRIDNEESWSRAPRTQVDDGGRYLRTPETKASHRLPRRSTTSRTARPSLGPILDNREQGTPGMRPHPRFNSSRFSLTLKGETPAGQLQRLLPDVKLA